MGLFGQQFGASLGAGAIGAGIQFGMNTAGGLINQAFAKRNAKLQAQYNRELMDYQYQLQQQAIDKQNAYNSPVNQMARLAEAGLNPNLVYGSLNNHNQTNIPSVGSPAAANYQQTDGGFTHLVQSINLVKDVAQMQDMINKTQLSSKQSQLYDVEAGVKQWLKDNLYPRQSQRLDLENVGLGYDNQVKKARAPWQELLAEQEYLSFHEKYTEQRLRNHILAQEYFNAPELMSLRLQKERQAIANMQLQNAGMAITNTLNNLSVDFNRWYNRYRIRNRMNLYTPTGRDGYFLRNNSEIVSSLYY